MKFSTTPWFQRFVAVMLLLLHPSILSAAEEVDPTLKLREQLRAVTLQLRTAQTESANAQAAAAASDQKSKDLTTKIETLEKQTAKLIKDENADKMAAARVTTALETKLAEREKRLALVEEALEKWQLGYRKAAALATTKEAARAKLAGTLSATKNTLADRERKNISLFNTANEILDRYQNYSLGKALLAREPYVGTTRVRIENLVQDYQDKILDNRISAPSTKP
jgi:hypothetical protein